MAKLRSRVARTLLGLFLLGAVWVLVRYQVTDGRVTDVALDDSRQAHVVVIVLASLATVGGLIANLLAWARVRA